MLHAERLGKYELVRHLASGGMARVYLARVSGVGGFERHVVLKTVRPERVEDQSYVTMFLDEARLVASLHHQHVAQVYEVGVADDGTYFLAMEYLHGETVRMILERARARDYRLPLSFALTVACAASAGLHHAHDRRGPTGQPLGIVHRDVSPSNVIVGYDGSIKLIDFGIAKAESRSTRTQTGFVKGKAGYMAPEQALGYAVDRRSDVFALGIVLYELSTQARAFRAASEYEAVQRIVRGDVRPPSAVCADYPPELEDVVMTALETDPDDRFQDADEMRRAIELTAHHLRLALGEPTVTRVLSDLFGRRPEPWMTIVVDDDDATVVDSESAPILAMRAGRRAARGSGSTPSQDPTARIITVEPDAPPSDAARSPRQQARTALGTTPPTNPGAAPASAPSAAPAIAQVARIDDAEPLTMPAIATSSAASSLSLGVRPLLIAAILVAAALAVGVIAMIAGRVDHSSGGPPIGAAVRRDPAPTPPAPRPPAPPPPLPAVVGPPAPATVTIQVTSVPDGATVLLDGGRLGKTPVTATIPASDAEIVLKIRKRGHAPQKMVVPADRDVSWDVRLRKR
jgi:eukaryotic-like serine/threonine-protein kinase